MPAKCSLTYIRRYLCVMSIAWVDIPEFAPLRRFWIHVMSFLEELEWSATVSTGSSLNQACEIRLGAFGTGLERQLDEFPVCRTLGLAIHSFSAIGCVSAVSCSSAAWSVRYLVRFGIGAVHVPSHRVPSPGFRRHVRHLHTYWIGSPVLTESIIQTKAGSGWTPYFDSDQ